MKRFSSSRGSGPKYEDHHKAEFTDKAIEASVKLSDRYITDRFLPDKAIDVMDEAGSRARIGTMTRPPEVKDLEAEIEEIKTKKERAIKNQDFEGAAAMRDKEKQAKEKLESVLKEWRTTREEKRVKVDEEDILHVVSKWTGIPLATDGAGRNAALAAGRNGNGQSGHRPEARPSRRCARRCAARAPTSRTRAGPSARLRCWAPPASARRSWPRPSRNSCSATRRRSSNST